MGSLAIRLLYPFMALFYIVGGLAAGPFIGWDIFQQDRKKWERGRW